MHQDRRVLEIRTASLGPGMSWAFQWPSGSIDGPAQGQAAITGPIRPVVSPVLSSPLLRKWPCTSVLMRHLHASIVVLEENFPDPLLSPSWVVLTPWCLSA